MAESEFIEGLEIGVFTLSRFGMLTDDELREPIEISQEVGRIHPQRFITAAVKTIPWDSFSKIRCQINVEKVRVLSPLLFL